MRRHRQFGGRSRSYSFGSRFRPRALANVKTRVTRLQRCQFMLRGDNQTASGGAALLTATNDAFELVKILDHIADFSTDSGVAMAGIVKSIDITRFHVDYGIEPALSDLLGDNGLYADTKWMAHIALAVDRISSAGVPDAVATTPWFSNQTPTASIGAGLPAQAEAEQQWPTRVLHERSWRLSTGNRIINNTTEGTLYAPATQKVSFVRDGYFSRNIRTRITDEQGLYFIFSVGNWTNGNQTGHFDYWAHGSFYYKVNF